MKQKTQKIYIVGAHSRARTLAVYLQYLNPRIQIRAFLYDNDEPNPSELDGVPVMSLNENRIWKTDEPVYIGTRGMYHNQIASHLYSLGFERIYPVNMELDLQMRNAFLKKYFAGMGREYVKIDHLNPAYSQVQAAVYVAESAFDKPLIQGYVPAPYEKRIQAGAALTQQRIEGVALTDAEGRHISGKNRQFCELTVLYWIWKNAREDIVGLAHYRRHFILPQNWDIIMTENRVDVILPVPLYVVPDLAGNYKSRHDSPDWDYMMEYLKERSRQEYNEAEEFFGKNLYSPCNMFIMRKAVLEELCSWLFPVLFAVAEHGGERADPYRNRYPGFLSERLITFYFEKYRHKYKIVYADKNFLI